MKNWLILSLALIMSLFLAGTAFSFSDSQIVSDYDIPSANIIVDGYSSDWNGIEPFINDAQGDACKEGMDIKACYLAKDQNFLYWRMDIWGDSYDEAHDTGPELHFFPQEVPFSGSTVDTDSSLSFMENHIHARVYSNDNDGMIWKVNSAGDFTKLYEGDAYGKYNSIAEGKIPLSVFGDVDYKDICFIYFFQKDQFPSCGSYDIALAGGDTGGNEDDLTTNLYYPHVASNNKWKTEICVINKGKQAVSGEIKLYSPKGTLISKTSETVNAYGRKTWIAGDEFKNPEAVRYVIFSSDSSSLCGYTKFYQKGLYRVAVPAVQEINTDDIYIPHIASNSNWWTGLALVNTTNSTKTLTFTFSNGAVKKKDWAPGEHKKFTIKQLFGGSSQPEIESAVITGGAGVIGLELFSKGKTLSGVTVKDDSTDTLYFPHVVSNDKWWTGIAAYNPSSSDANLTVTPYTESGSALDALSVDVAAGEKHIGNAKGWLLPQNTAWFKIDSSQSLNGFELFGTTNGNALAGYSTVNINRQEGVFPKLDHEGWTGIAFVNTSEAGAKIDLSIYDNDGFKVSEKSISLAGYEKVVDNPENIFGGSISAATHMRFSSDSDVVGFQLNGSNDGMMLDGLPGM